LIMLKEGYHELPVNVKPLLGSPSRKVSKFGTIVNTFKCITGTGILSLPYAIAVGRGVSVIMLVFFGLICCFTAMKICHSVLSGASPYKDYNELGRASLGPIGGTVMGFVQAGELFGVCLILLVLCGTSLSTLPYCGGLPVWLGIIISCIVLLVLITFFPNTAEVAWISALGSLNIFFTFLVILIEGFGTTGHLGANMQLLFVVPSIREILISIGCIIFTFTAHGNFPIIVVEAQQPRKVNESMRIAFITAIALQTLFAVLGFVIYGPLVHQSVNLSVRSDFLRSALGASIILDKLTTFPIVYVPLEQIVCKATKARSVITIRALLFTIMTASGLLLLDNFAIVVSLVGNMLCSLDAFVFPIIFTFALLRVARWEYLILISTFILGCISFIAGVGADMKEVLG